MTFFSYVDRQKMRIRENHSGEESIYLRGEAVQIKGADGEAVRKNYAERLSEEDKFVAAAMRAEPCAKPARAVPPLCADVSQKYSRQTKKPRVFAGQNGAQKAHRRYAGAFCGLCS